MTQTAPELAAQIVQLRRRLDQQWEAADDPPRRRLLAEQMDRLDAQIMRLLAAEVQARGPAYAAATAALRAANQRMRKTLKTEDDFLTGLDLAARAIALLAELVRA